MLELLQGRFSSQVMEIVTHRDQGLFPKPGEISLAHRGVLFLDEVGEFPPHLLDALRQPIEEGSVVVARKGAATGIPW